MMIKLTDKINVNLSGAYYQRHTYYKYHDNVKAHTFEVGLGLTYGI